REGSHQCGQCLKHNRDSRHRRRTCCLPDHRGCGLRAPAPRSEPGSAPLPPKSSRWAHARPPSRVSILAPTISLPRKGIEIRARKRERSSGKVVPKSLKLPAPPRSAACRSWTPPESEDRRGIQRVSTFDPQCAPLAVNLVVLVDPGLEPLEEPGKR